MSKKKSSNASEQKTGIELNRRVFLSRTGKMLAFGSFAMIGKAVAAPSEGNRVCLWFWDDCTNSKANYTCSLLNKNDCSEGHTCDETHTNTCYYANNFSCLEDYTCTSNSVNVCQADVME